MFYFLNNYKIHSAFLNCAPPEANLPASFIKCLGYCLAERKCSMNGCCYYFYSYLCYCSSLSHCLPASAFAPFPVHSLPCSLCNPLKTPISLCQLACFFRLIFSHMSSRQARPTACSQASHAPRSILPTSPFLLPSPRTHTLSSCPPKFLSFRNQLRSRFLRQTFLDLLDRLDQIHLLHLYTGGNLTY